MRASLCRFAASVSQAPIDNTTAAAAQLLPPLQLYRRLLRAHRTLPNEMRSLGDDYVKSEFRRTKTTDNPLQVIGFLGQWKLYLDEIEGDKVTAEGYRGKKLDADTLSKLNAEQLGQLYELLQATKEIYGESNTHDAIAAAVERGAGHQG